MLQIYRKRRKKSVFQVNLEKSLFLIRRISIFDHLYHWDQCCVTLGTRAKENICYKGMEQQPIVLNDWRLQMTGNTEVTYPKELRMVKVCVFIDGKTCERQFIIIVSIFVKNLYCGGASWAISRLAPAPQRSSTVVHSLCVLIAKHDIVARCIHR